MKENRKNYQKKLESIIKEVQSVGTVPQLLLHSCCGPCSTYVIEYLSDYFYITVFYYNPNIDEREEYQKRALEQKKLIQAMDTKYPLKFVEGPYDVDVFRKMSKHMTQEPEGGKRCFACYKLRLKKTAKYAKANGFDYFTTTLTISPLKNAAKLNQIGSELEELDGPAYLYSDFKKKDGYKRSIQLSKEHDLYRQDYCGCSYSKRDAMSAGDQPDQSNPVNP